MGRPKRRAGRDSTRADGPRGERPTIVLRLLKGETLDALSRELQVSSARLAQWRGEARERPARAASGLISLGDASHPVYASRPAAASLGALPLRTASAGPETPPLMDTTRLAKGWARDWRQVSAGVEGRLFSQNSIPWTSRPRQAFSQHDRRPNPVRTPSSGRNNMTLRRTISEDPVADDRGFPSTNASPALP